MSVLLAAGASWLVQWCGQGLTWSGEVTVTVAEIRAKTLDRTQAQRLRGHRVTRTVMVAERWQNDAGHDLVMFFESGPGPRSTGWFT